MTYRVLSPHLPEKEESIPLPQTESHHLLHVLRASSGDKVWVTDGKNRQVECELQIQDGLAYVKKIGEITLAANQTWDIELVMGITKSDSMEWIIEKCVELGIRRVTPLQTHRSVVKTRGDEQKFTQRWQKIADQALKQCGRLQSLEIKTPLSLQAWQPDSGSVFFLDEKSSEPLLANCLDSIKKTVTLICGPEGGWTNEERQALVQKAQSVSLGSLILRAETAAVFSISLVVGKLQTLLDKQS